MELHTFGFIGLGLIGGSLAKALRRATPGCHIMAYTRTAKTVEEALRQGVIDDICTSPADSQFAECDCIFLCAPVGSNITALEQLKDLVRTDCILTDVGSVKTDIHLAAEHLGLNGRFIGGHPMTGSEKSGLAYSQAHLFENSYYIITPSLGTPEEWVETYRALASSIGALPLVLDYRQHDFATAAVSHLPHLIAASLVNTVHDLDSKDELMKLIAAGGFKDITRIASSSPEMWEHICISNGDNIISVMDTFIDLLTASREAMYSEDGEYIYKMFEKSRDYRDSFASSSPGSIKKTYRIYCDIVDESGAISTIATLLAGKNISIKNIGIVHSREYEEGVLRIEFYEEMPSKEAAKVLRDDGYQVWER
ncbi:MAG: prephenate dehydrogenase [Lachnospiraceae bacterium]|nr:prephenate dehydrogenase [Lachnospiraceae bacterium]